MSPLSLLTVARRSLGTLRFTPMFTRHHSSLTTELIENMDKKATWDRFYTENNSSSSGGRFKNFEWFFGFDSVRDLVLPLLRPPSGTADPLQVLDMGCGTSALGPGIYQHSPVRVSVTCADISPIAVRQMREHLESRAIEPKHPLSALAFLELDCGELTAHFGARRLDLIVDKGTTDAMLRSKDGGGKAGHVVRQCLRTLRGSGRLLQFSDEDPDARLPWLETEGGRGSGVGGGAADVAVHEVGTFHGVQYYCYEVTPRPAG